jgi:hypothetical protein
MRQDSVAPWGVGLVGAGANGRYTLITYDAARRELVLQENEEH